MTPQEIKSNYVSPEKMHQDINELAKSWGIKISESDEDLDIKSANNLNGGNRDE